jgi:steroid 5-alpha reductase family enzyme
VRARMSLPAVQTRPWSGFAIVGFAYAVAFVAASAVAQALAGSNPMVVVALADVAATVAVFIFSRAFNNTSVYDPYWSLAPIPIAAYLALGPGAGNGFPLRAVVVLTIVTLYGVRLTWNWARGWAGLSHEDWRYAGFREQLPRTYWLMSFFGLHFFPTVMVLLGCLPLFGALVEPQHPFGPLDVIAALVTLGAITIEGVADNQLRAFRQHKRAEGDICDVGLWRYSRHPNYFGEASFWVGLYLFGLAAGAPAWTGVGALAMLVLFVGASIPMAEKRSLKRRPHYAEHQRKVSMLVPWFPKN